MFYSGQGGKVTFGATDVHVADWEFTDNGRLAEVTNSGSGGAAKYALVVTDGEGTFNTPWDSTQDLGTDVALKPGDTGTAKFHHGSSGSFLQVSIIVSSNKRQNNAVNDVVRQSISFKANGAVTYPA